MSSSEASVSSDVKKARKAFKGGLSERMQCWKEGIESSAVADIAGATEEIWHQNDDIVIFPTTLT
jgi:hypothetical protein